MRPGQARSSLSSRSWPGARWLKRSRCSSRAASSGMEPVSCIRPASRVSSRMMDTTNSGSRTPAARTEHTRLSSPTALTSGIKHCVHCGHHYIIEGVRASVTRQSLTCKISLDDVGHFSKVTVTVEGNAGGHRQDVTDVCT